MTVNDALKWVDELPEDETIAPITRTLAVEVQRLRAVLDVPTDARELVIKILGWKPPYKGCEEKHIQSGIDVLIAYRARLLDEAAERGAKFLEVHFYSESGWSIADFRAALEGGQG